MTKRTKLVECKGCDGYGYCEYAENRCTAARRYTCTDCHGSGEVRQLMTEEEIEAEAFERAEEREYDRQEEAGLDDWRGA